VKRWRFNHPGKWFTPNGRGKRYMPATWEGWTIFIGSFVLVWTAAAFGWGG